MMACMHQFSTPVWANTATTSVLAVCSRWDPNMKICIPFHGCFSFSLFLCTLKVHWRNWLKKGRVKDCKQIRNTGKLTQKRVYDWNPDVIALIEDEWHQGWKAWTLIRIMGSHLKVAISVTLEHRCSVFSFNFLSVSIIFSSVLHIPALCSLTAGLCVCFHILVSSHMPRQCDTWRFPELK